MRHVQRFGNAGRVSVFEFKAEPSSVHEQQKVQIRSPLSVPGIRLAIAGNPQHLLEGESFPRRAKLGMRLQPRKRGDAQQLMQQLLSRRYTLGDFTCRLLMFSNHGGNYRITNAPLRMSRCRFTVVCASPRERPISEAFQICPW